MKPIILSIILCEFASLGFANNIEETKRLNMVGVSLGATQGFGFSYRFIPNRFAFQLTALPLFLNNRRNYISTGFSVFYTLEKGRRFELLAYFSNSYDFANFTENDLWVESESNGVSPFNVFNFIPYNPGYHASVGLGGNIHLAIDKVILSLQFGYGLANIDTTPQSILSPALGIFYKF